MALHAPHNRAMEVKTNPANPHTIIEHTIMAKPNSRIARELLVGVIIVFTLSDMGPRVNAKLFQVVNGAVINQRA